MIAKKINKIIPILYSVKYEMNSELKESKNNKKILNYKETIATCFCFIIFSTSMILFANILNINNLNLNYFMNKGFFFLISSVFLFLFFLLLKKKIETAVLFENIVFKTVELLDLKIKYLSFFFFIYDVKVYLILMFFTLSYLLFNVLNVLTLEIELKNHIKDCKKNNKRLKDKLAALKESENFVEYLKSNVHFRKNFLELKTSKLNKNELHVYNIIFGNVFPTIGTNLRKDDILIYLENKLGEERVICTE